MSRFDNTKVLEYLREQEKIDPYVREKVAGSATFDYLYKLLLEKDGVRIETVLAILASAGGAACIAPILKPILESGNPDFSLEQYGLTAVKGADGLLYFFGDPPNRLLLESTTSLLSLAFGTAKALGAPVTMDMVYEEMTKVASRVGGSQFEDLDLPEQHKVDRPTMLARQFGPKLSVPMHLYDVPPMRHATAFGFALQKAIEKGQQVLNPMIAAKIVLQCAVRSSKVYLAQTTTLQ